MHKTDYAKLKVLRNKSMNKTLCNNIFIFVGKSPVMLCGVLYACMLQLNLRMIVAIVVLLSRARAVLVLLWVIRLLNYNLLSLNFNIKSHKIKVKNNFLIRHDKNFSTKKCNTCCKIVSNIYNNNNFGTNTLYRARPRTYSKLWIA